MSYGKDPEEPESGEPVWTYRGYRLKGSEFVSALAHQFRAESQRANVWLTRLDATTNWAVIITGISISIAFSEPKVHHGVLILNGLLVTLFLIMEARRYRYYEMWNYRVRELETGFFAAMLTDPFHPSPKWAEGLTKQLRILEFPIPMIDALGVRLRRNYIWIFLMIGVAWIIKYGLFPTPANTIGEFYSRASIGPVPGVFVVGFSAVYFVFIALAAVLTMKMSHSVIARGGMEIQPQPKTMNTSTLGGRKPATRTKLHTKNIQYLAFIVTKKSDVVAGRVLTELHRGVTSVTSDEDEVLLCALTAKEIATLKEIVIKEDAQASVLVTSASEIWGIGFDPLQS